MIIDRLPPLPSAPASGDELAIERGVNVYKIDYDALAAAIIAQTQRDIAIVVEGNKTTHTGGAAAGAYVIVHNSTISGIADGLYKAVQAIPANTTITSAYLAAVDGGGLNEIGSTLKNIGNIYENYYAMEVHAATVTQLGSFSLDPGAWIIVSTMDLTESFDMTYANIVNVDNQYKTVRANGLTGGGVDNVIITTNNSTINVSISAYIETNVTVRCWVKAIRIK